MLSSAFIQQEGDTCSVTAMRKAPLWMCLDVPGCVWDPRTWHRWPKAKLVTRSSRIPGAAGRIPGAARLLHTVLAAAHKLHLSPVSPVPDTSGFVLSPQCPSLWCSPTHTNPFNFSSHSMLLPEHNAAPQPQNSNRTKLHRTNHHCLEWN